MNKPFKDLIVIELAGVLAGPSAGLFFTELGAKVIKIENPKTKGDITRSWKLSTESAGQDTSAYYWSVNAGKDVVFLDLTKQLDLEKFYTLIKMADVVITNYKKGDDEKLKVHYRRLSRYNPRLIYASISGFGKDNMRTAYDLILQAESGFMYMNGEKGSKPLKMPVALIDILAGHQLKEAILIALYNREKTNKGSHITVSLFDSAIASLANQATNWLIAHHLPEAQGSLHPNIAPYGEIFETKDKHLITFAIGSDKQFKHICEYLKLSKISDDILFSSNQQRIKNRKKLFEIMYEKITKLKYQDLFDACLNLEIPIAKIRNLEEVFELPEAQSMLKHFKYQKNNLTSVKSVAFKMS